MAWQDIRNCAECGKIYANPNQLLCPACNRKAEEDFQACVEYLRLQPDESATFKELSEATGVTIKRIMQFVRERRFIAKGFNKLKYPCARCGDLITSEKYCRSCKEELKDDMKLAEELLNEQSESSNRSNYFVRK